MNNPPKTLDDMVQHEEYNVYESESVMSLQHRIINSTHYEDINIVTHEEILQCMESFIDDMLQDDLDDLEWMSISEELTDLWNYHDDNNTLTDVVVDFSEVN